MTFETEPVYDEKDFEKQYKTWLKPRLRNRPDRQLRHQIIKKEFTQLALKNPEQAGKMLAMYYETCGGIKK